MKLTPCTSALLTFLLAVPAAVALQEPGAASKSIPPSKEWEHATSDLKPSARIHFGALPNGLRYAWLDNAEPKDRAFLRLHVDAGSLGETDAEQGMAHFLEHMAFNGSKHFAPGTLVEWLQKRGLGFGDDTNAFTDYSQTVYMLDLPGADEATVADGLTVMRDVLDGLLLLQSEVAAEKGVIDGEERERDSVQFRVMRRVLTTLYAGTLVPERLPIGTKSARDTFDAASVRAFWERWYRPEHCTLLLVGDLEGRDPTAQLTTAFADAKQAAVPAGKEPPRGKAKLAQKAYCIHDAEIPIAQLSVAMLKPYVAEPDNRKTRLEDLALDYAREVVNLRFSEIAKKPDTPFLAAQLGQGGGMDVLDGEELMVVCAPEKWKEALHGGQQEVRRALLHGFEKSELDEVRANALRSLDEAVESEPTKASDAWMQALLSASEERYVPTDAAAERELLKAAIEALTVEQCLLALRTAWSQGKLVVSSLGGLDLGADAEKQLTEAWEGGAKDEVAATKRTETTGWGYASDPAKAGKAAVRAHDVNLDCEILTFENGVRAFVKKTDFVDRQVLVRALVGEGRLTLDPKEQALPWYAPNVFVGCGLGKHSADDLRRLTAGKEVGFQFGVLDDTFALTGATTADDLLLECELLCAFLTDAGWREEGMTQLKRFLPQLYERRAHEPGAVLQDRYFPALYGNDPRVGWPSLEAAQAVTTERLKSWLGTVFADAPTDVVIVGDLDVEATVTALAQTFGVLSKRRAPQEFAERRAFPPLNPGLKESYSVDSKDTSAIVLVTFAVPDGRDATMRRNVRFLASVIADRLRVEIREKLGASYSPNASASGSLTYPGRGMLTLEAAAEPDKVEALIEACLAVTDLLAKEGVTDDEVDRLRPGLLANLKEQVRTNPFWIELLGGHHVGRAVTEEFESLIPHHENLKAGPLTELAKRFLPRDHASIGVALPATK